jgi:hypothetical protein
MMTKPNKLPEWDTNEVNSVEVDGSRKTAGWLAPGGVPEKPPFQYFNYWQNLVYKWVKWLDEGVGKTIITSQVDFDNIFDGTTLENLDIFLVKKDTPYILNHAIPFGGNLIIDGNNAEVFTASMYNFNSIGTIANPIENVYFTENWSVDGTRGTGPVFSTGGFANLRGIKNSRFLTKVKNCKVSTQGGGYRIFPEVGTAINIEIANVDGCESNSHGGGVSSGSPSVLSIQGCYIHDITNCISGSGGGVYGIHQSKIENISYCSASSGGGGGGVEGCTYCEINNIHHCEVANALSGGGVDNSIYCTISNVSDCSAAESLGQGGGCAFCHHCVFIGLFLNNAAPTNNNLHDCQYGISFASDGVTSKVVTAVSTIAWD